MSRAYTALRLLRGAARNGLVVQASDLATVGASDRYQLISVDVFETLLRRSEPGASVIRAAVAAAATRFAGRRTRRPSLTDFEAAARRAKVENRLGEELRKHGNDPEVSHREVLRVLLDEFLGERCTEEDLDRLCDYEVELEAHYTRSDHALAGQLDALRRAGRRVVAVSDMYLSATELDTLLRFHGVAVDRVYTSSDVSLSKFSGRLYPHIAKSEGVEPNDILHVGDNILGDVWAARAAGVSAVHWKSTHRPTPPLPRARSDEAYRLGYETVGPPLVAAARLLLRRAETADIEEIAFVARDGDLLKQITERLLAGRPSLYSPRLSYVYLSRRSTGAAALSRLRAVDVSDVLAAKATNRGFRTVFDAYNLDASAFSSHLDRLGQSEFEQPIDGSDPRIARFLEDEAFQAAFAQEACRQRALLHGYLTSVGLIAEGRRAALADVGWRGTIQSSLGRAFGDDPHYAIKRGFYIGLWDDGIIGPPQDLDEKEGLLSDFRRRRSVNEGAAWYLAFVLEALSRANHGTVLGYSSGVDGATVPVTAGVSASRSGELAGEHVREPIRDGILARAEVEAGSYRTLLADESSLRRKAQRALLRLAFFPRRRELEMLATMAHTESFAEDWFARLVADPETHSLFRPRSWLAGLQSPWRAGFVRMTGGYPLATMFMMAEAALLVVPRSWRSGLRRHAVQQMRGGTDS